MFQTKEPKDDSKYQWTNHVKDKMRYYRISESLVKRVVRFPKRVEEGIAPGTTAVMVPRLIGSRNAEATNKPKFGGRRSNQEEIWVMYVEIGDKRQGARDKEEKKLGAGYLSLVSARKRIITAWRYPGVSPVGKEIPIPDDIRSEIENIQ